MPEDQYFRPRQWAKFQSRSNNSMAWIKNYTALLQDPDYLNLTPLQRAVLHGVWLLCGVRGRPVPLVSSYCGRALAMRSQDCGAALKVLLSSNFIELCDPTQNLHEKLPHLEEIREEEIREKETPSVSSPLDFENWWQGYPRKVGKRKAETIYRRLVSKGEVTEDELLSGVNAYCAYLDSQGTETQFMAHPTTWLNEGRWKDDLTVRRKPTQAEQLQAWVQDGDERDDHGGGEIDGSGVEIPRRQSDGNSSGVLLGTTGSERRGREAGNGAHAGDMAEDDSTQAGGSEDDRERIAALTSRAAKNCKA